MTASRDERGVSRSLWARGLKRAFDVAVAGAGLAVTAPIFGAIGVGIKVSSPGPVFFSQDRAGYKGRRFKMLKFRSMSVPDPNAPPVDQAATGQQRDVARVTPFGELIRRYKLDELPQLVNILRGDMSLIGPRPTLPEQAENYDTFQRRRLDARPGLTGLAQVNGSAGIDWDERIKYDAYYVAHHDLKMDALIFVKTPLVVLLGETRFTRLFEDSPFSR